MPNFNSQLAATIARLSSGWTTEYHARDAFGWPVSITSPNAACWCLVGAASVVDSSGTFLSWLYDQAAKPNSPPSSFHGSLTDFNDSTSQSTVIAWLESLKQQET